MDKVEREELRSDIRLRMDALKPRVCSACRARDGDCRNPHNWECRHWHSLAMEERLIDALDEMEQRAEDAESEWAQGKGSIRDVRRAYVPDSELPEGCGDLDALSIYAHSQRLRAERAEAQRDEARRHLERAIDYLMTTPLGRGRTRASVEGWVTAEAGND